MQIVTYPHPTLRHVSKPLRRVDGEIRRLVEEMFDLMYQAKGIGLAANQVNLPLRLFVVNEKGDPKATEHERVFLNPVLSQRKGRAEEEEGCLSLPNLFGQVSRPERIAIHAYDLAGQEIREELTGMLARVVQHETDHLDGVLFIDRLTPTGQLEVKSALEEFELIFRNKVERQEVPSAADWKAHLEEWQGKYC